jgi:metal-sulfur cluster biosynthetic enzyme
VTDLLEELRRKVLAALDTVQDPELDEPVTSLGFVSSCTVGGSAGGSGGETVGGLVVDVRLRLPTYFCAPNFAFLMVADAYDAVSAVPGVARAQVVLEDHFASDAINGGVAAHAGFVDSFEGEAVGELETLRADFLRKAVLAGTDKVARPLLTAGATTAELATTTLGQVPASADLQRLRGRRAQLGLSHDDDAPLLVDPATGAAVGVDALPLHLRKARLTAVSIEANGGVCRGMLAARYPDTVGVAQVG